MSDKSCRRRKETWKAADVQCPFYVKDCPQTIECEGMLEQTTDILKFHTADAKNTHMGVYCVGRFQSCPKYQSVYTTKYAD